MSEAEFDEYGELSEELCPNCEQIWDECDCHIGDECGRWNNGKLMDYCTKAGSEECDWDCPYSSTLK